MHNLTYQQYIIGGFRIDGTRIHGQNGPDFPEIIVNAQLDLSPYEGRGNMAGNDAADRETFPYTVTDLVGTLRLKLEPGSRGETRTVCCLGSDLNPRYVQRPHDQSVKLTGRLTPHHVNQLEKRRRSGDLHLQVSCSLTLYFEKPPSESERFGRVEDDIDVTIPRSHWTDTVYPRLGGREVFVIEIPKGEPSIEAAWAKIEDAMDARQNWNVEGASIACREAADAMDRAVKEHFGKESCTNKERWYRAYDGIKDPASLAAHFERIRNEANSERPCELRVGQEAGRLSSEAASAQLGDRIAEQMPKDSLNLIPDLDEAWQRGVGEQVNCAYEADLLAFEGTTRTVQGAMSGTVTIRTITENEVTGSFTLHGQGVRTTRTYENTTCDDSGQIRGDWFDEETTQGPITLRGDLRAPNHTAGFFRVSFVTETVTPHPQSYP